MSDKIEELSLPSAVITRILKDAIPEGINVSKEARSAIARAASIFILYTTACSSQVLATTQRKTLTAPDVFTALEDMMFDDMIGIVKECVESFHADKGKKETMTSPSKSSNLTPKPKRKRSLAKDSEIMTTLNTESLVLDQEIQEQVVTISTDNTTLDL